LEPLSLVLKLSAAVHPSPPRRRLCRFGRAAVRKPFSLASWDALRSEDLMRWARTPARTLSEQSRPTMDRRRRILTHALAARRPFQIRRPLLIQYIAMEGRILRASRCDTVSSSAASALAQGQPLAAHRCVFSFPTRGPSFRWTGVVGVWCGCGP
jgi:hypothetical protein